MGVKYFIVDTTPTYPGKYMIRVAENTIPCGLKEGGSFGVLPSRLLQISYVNYLRLCRDEFGAELVGRNSTYIVPYFEDFELAHKLAKLLNSYANAIAMEYDIRQLKKQLEMQKKLEY